MEEDMKSSFRNVVVVVAGLLLTGCALQLDDSHPSNSATHAGSMMATDSESTRSSSPDVIASDPSGPTNELLSLRQALVTNLAPQRLESNEISGFPEPPPPQVDRIGASPGFGYRWIAGAWTWQQGGWVWIKGRWELPPRSTATWVPGRWGTWRGKPTWINGHWR
jgi:hypothetical protein